MSLYALAKAGDSEALAELVRHHIPLVQALSRRFSYCEDAFQQGCMGLVKAIRKYQEESGCQFSTYAVPIILGEMRRAYSNTLGWRSRAKIKKALNYQEQMLRQSGTAPSVREIAKRIGMEPAELVWLLEQNLGPVYDETGLLFAAISDPQSEAWLIRFCIRDVLERLPEDESYLIRQRFIQGKSQAELAQELLTTQSSISRQEKQARKHFRQAWKEGEP
ncbi:MAG: sigma-70 family RNA polymerase sigma factor [Clostridia bacterium]|nr:sigma-70 family RNA polymerase sigma factor [Clostridia bacterium]